MDVQEIDMEMRLHPSKAIIDRLPELVRAPTANCGTSGTNVTEL